MARFTVRVELHNASSADYQELYDQMEKKGFTDTITTDKGTVQMPPGEYNYDGGATREQVLEKAKSAASQVVRSYSVLVTESAGRTWHNLDSV